MSPPLEHDYTSSASHLKETELRLGLPGSISPERTTNPQLGGSGFTLFGKDFDDGKNNIFAVSGALRDCFAQNHVLEKNIQAVAAASGDNSDTGNALAAKAQVVGWPPIRSFRKNSMATSSIKNTGEPDGNLGEGCLYVKVSMDGAPCLRTVDLNTYTNYSELSSALEKKFSCFTIGKCGSHGLPGRDGISESHLIDHLHGSEFVITYEDKDGDWMLVGDVPWQMFVSSCRRMRIMKGSEAIGLAPRAMEKSKHRN